MTKSNYRELMVVSVAAGLLAGACLFGAGFKTGRAGQVPRSEMEDKVDSAERMAYMRGQRLVISQLPNYSPEGAWDTSNEWVLQDLRDHYSPFCEPYKK